MITLAEHLAQTLSHPIGISTVLTPAQPGRKLCTNTGMPTDTLFSSSDQSQFFG